MPSKRKTYHLDEGVKDRQVIHLKDINERLRQENKDLTLANAMLENENKLAKSQVALLSEQADPDAAGGDEGSDDEGIDDSDLQDLIDATFDDLSGWAADAIDNLLTLWGRTHSASINPMKNHGPWLTALVGEHFTGRSDSLENKAAALTCYLAFTLFRLNDDQKPFKETAAQGWAKDCATVAKVEGRVAENWYSEVCAGVQLIVHHGRGSFEKFSRGVNGYEERLRPIVDDFVAVCKEWAFHDDAFIIDPLPSHDLHRGDMDIDFDPRIHHPVLLGDRIPAVGQRVQAIMFPSITRVWEEDGSQESKCIYKARVRTHIGGGWDEKLVDRQKRQKRAAKE